MKVKIVKNCNGILESEEMKIKSGYEEENFAYKLEFEFPDFLEEYNKIIEFELNGEKVADALLGNEYELKNNVTKYSYVPCQVVFTKEIDEEHTQVYKTNKFYLEFGNSINADIDIDPESEEVSVLNTLLEQVSLALEEVTDVIEKGNYAKEQGDYAKEQGDLASDEVERIETMLDNGELNGATFIPSINDSGDISWTNDKGLPNPQTKNVKGDTGLTPDISVGSTTTLAPGTNAYVEILGTPEAPIINFYIPRGDNGRIEFRLVNELPVVGETGIIYLVPEEDPEVQNRYDEYIWINNAWEKFGSASIDIDLDKYYTKEEIATILLDYVTNSSLATTLASYETKADLVTDLADYVKNTDYATYNVAGVVKGNTNAFQVNTSGVPSADVRTYENYNNAGNSIFVSKGTLENVITGKGLVSNTDYATSNTGGVIKISSTYAESVSASGVLMAQVKDYATYNSGANGMFISKGTLENVITGKDLTTKAYVDGLVGDIGTILDNINGESVGA